MKNYLLLAATLAISTGYGQSWTKQYNYVDEFKCGLAMVDKGGRHGFADKTGKLVLPLKYDDALSFQEGMAAVKWDGKWGYRHCQSDAERQMAEYRCYGKGGEK